MEELILNENEVLILRKCEEDYTSHVDIKYASSDKFKSSGFIGSSTGGIGITADD